MKKREVFIKLKSRPGLKKSRYTQLLNNFLQEEGFETELRQEEYRILSEEKSAKEYAEAISDIYKTRKTKIILIEEQLPKI